MKKVKKPGYGTAVFKNQKGVSVLINFDKKEDYDVFFNKCLASLRKGKNN